MKQWKATLAMVILCGWTQAGLAGPPGVHGVTGTSLGGGAHAGVGVAAGETLSIAVQPAASVSGHADHNHTEKGWRGDRGHSGRTQLGTVSWIAMPAAGSRSADVSQSDHSLDSLSEQFLSAEGYVLQNVEELNAAIETQLTALNPGSVFLPGAELSPFVKAVLALEATDGPVERTRYRIRYGLEMVGMPPAADPVPISFVQIDRFNLGPAIRNELVAVHGESNVAPPSAFGEEGHVSWRLVTRPLMGTAADITAAARTEIDDTAAESMICLGTPCLSTASAVEGAVPWSNMEAIDREPDAPYETERGGLPTPAAVIEMLTAGFGFEPRESVGPTEPFAEAIVEINLGQDATLDAALREGELMDTSLRGVWQRISAISSGQGGVPQFFSARAFECRRGPHVAEPGEYCP